MPIFLLSLLQALAYDSPSHSSLYLMFSTSHQPWPLELLIPLDTRSLAQCPQRCAPCSIVVGFVLWQMLESNRF